jgi:hypothetical protein
MIDDSHRCKPRKKIQPTDARTRSAGAMPAGESDLPISPAVQNTSLFDQLAP